MHAVAVCALTHCRMLEAEAWSAALRILGVQIKIAQFTPVTVESVHIFLALAASGLDITLLCASGWITRARSASCLRERVVSRLASVTLVSHHSWLTAASASVITLSAERPNRVAAAGQTALTGGLSVVVGQASLTLRPICIVSTVTAVTSVTSGTIQLRVEVTFSALSITVTRQTLVGVFSSGSPPGTVIIEGFAHIAVGSFCVVFAVTHQLAVLVLHTLTGMAIALAPSSHSKIRDGVVVGFEDFGIVENFISESV